ncbi:hypothetical protein POL68_36350 [Stigmatella sp. ncwal1]|uniref:Uncharacterized protein n=1 Tax=Stigmatella ashevillensis TaxID=2995309 RepID=A0ABT5DLT7_9BACT|nr:hypothetical protein [Stigmatella ashevillena]MDC0713994.1 hypothetical protein [Stigmatella ashevillena]
MGIDSVGGSSSSRGTSSSASDNASKSSQASQTTESKQADAAAEASKKAAEAAAVEKAAITAQTNFNVSSFTAAASTAGMPSLTAPQFSANMLDPTPVAEVPTLTAPDFAANLTQATPMGPLSAFEKSAPIPQARPEVATQTANLTYGPKANADAVSAHSQKVLGEIMNTAGVNSATISSTARAPEDQARAMYDNLQAKGIASQKDLYSKFGDQVIDAYAASVDAGQTKEQTLQAMVDKINELGPSNVSRHLANPSQLNVVDIAPSSIPADKREAFQEAIRAHPEVSKFLGPADGDPAYHIEIPQPQAQ